MDPHSPTLSSPSSPSSSPRSWFSRIVRTRTNKSGGSRMGAAHETDQVGNKMDPHSPTLSSPSSLSSSPRSWFSGIVPTRSNQSGGSRMGADSTPVAMADYRSPVVGKHQFRGVLFKYVPTRSNQSGGSRMGADSTPVAMADYRSPVVGKHQFRGVLFKYGPNAIQVAFRTGDHKRQVIFIGGLANGFLATAYLEPLAIALERENWSLVQFLMSSSYSGYGTSSLQQDAKELDLLINYLIDKEDSEGVILLGHSTGCQDIIHYMSTNAACTRAVRAAIFQAPVSDREYQATLPHTASMTELAANMISEGRSSEFIPRDADPNGPITAYRYSSLCSYNGEDDMFSSDLSDGHLRMRLGHMSRTQCQVIFSMSDENVPDYVDKKLLAERAMGGAEKVELENGSHSLWNRAEEVVSAIMDFIKREGPQGWDDPWTSHEK